MKEQDKLRKNSGHNYTEVRISLVHLSGFGPLKSEKTLGVYNRKGITPAESEALFRQLIQIMLGSGGQGA
ncbi:MAG: hypothetical protein JRM98_05465 [Nitrososphaerota archaeon]|jgi:hypothetical protein|nr:hypothetical protein [Nitrososphaerota archaeon]MDG7043546.1 hypothetical protein [Nitrososphaerota archaeon]